MGRRVWVPVVSGPLAPFAAGFESWLRSRAYSRSAAADRLYQFDQLSRWLEREGLGVSELTVEQAERFAAGRRAAGLVTWVSPQSVGLPVGYLRGLGVTPVPAPVLAQGPLEGLLADYRRYLSVERGLCDHTVLDAYEPAARLFLAGWEGPDGVGLERLSAAEVSSFVARECPRRSVSGARDLVCALRSLLRYLHLAGLIEAPLVWAVPSLADLRDRTLPRQTIFEIGYHHARNRQIQQLPRLTPHATYLVLAPFLGRAEANEFIDEKLREYEQRSPRSTGRRTAAGQARQRTAETLRAASVDA